MTLTIYRYLSNHMSDSLTLDLEGEVRYVFTRTQDLKVQTVSIELNRTALRIAEAIESWIHKSAHQRLEWISGRLKSAGLVNLADEDGPGYILLHSDESDEVWTRVAGILEIT